MEDSKKTGSIFWWYFTIVSILTLGFLGIFAIQNESLYAGMISIVMSFMLIFSIIMSKGEMFRLKGSFRKNSFFFILGFISWGCLIVFKKINNNPNSVLNYIVPTKNILFARISSNLPLKWIFIIDNIVNPFIEEMFWLIGLPVGIILLFDLLGNTINSLSFLKSSGAKFTAIIIAGITFPLFHVGMSAVFAFLISAFIFRGILSILFWGDELFDLFDKITMLASAMVGMHMANNWVNFGFLKGIALLSTSFIGWIILIGFLGLIVAGIDYFIEKPIDLFTGEF